MSRSHVGRWTPVHKGIFAVAVCIAVVGAFALLAPKIAVGAKPGINTYIPGKCGVRIAHVDKNGQPILKPQDWTISDEKRKLFADGTNHTGTVFIPTGTYYFNSGSYSQIGSVGRGKCDGKAVLHTFKRRM